MPSPNAMHMRGKFSYFLATVLAIGLHGGIIYSLIYFNNLNLKNSINSPASPRYLETKLVDLNFKPITSIPATLLFEPIIKTKVATKNNKKTPNTSSKKLEEVELTQIESKKIKKQNAKKDTNEVKADKQKTLIKKAEKIKKPTSTKPRAQANKNIENGAQARPNPTDKETKVARIYQRRIQKQIEKSWTKPLNIRNQSTVGLEVFIKLKLNEEGKLLEATIEKTSGNEPFDRSALIAIKKIGKFQVPSERRIFELYFRNLIINYKI